MNCTWADSAVDRRVIIPVMVLKRAASKPTTVIPALVPPPIVRPLAVIFANSASVMSYCIVDVPMPTVRAVLVVRIVC